MAFRVNNNISAQRSAAQSNQNLNTVTQGPLAPRQFSRPAIVNRTLKEMASKSKRGVASYVMMHSANAKLDKFHFNYKTHLCKQANVVKPPPKNEDGKRMLDLTVCMNVSGHAGDGKVHDFAETNKYNIRVTFPNGDVKTMRNIDRLNSDGREYASAQDISFELMKGKTVIEAWPQGSAGVAGYVEGRRYELNYGDKHEFDPKSTDEIAWSED